MSNSRDVGVLVAALLETYRHPVEVRSWDTFQGSEPVAYVHIDHVDKLGPGTYSLLTVTLSNRRRYLINISEYGS